MEGLKRAAKKALETATGISPGLLENIRSRQRMLAILLHLFIAVMVFTLAFLFLLTGVPVIRENLIPPASKPVSDSSLVSGKAYTQKINSLRKEVTTIERRFDAMTPGQNYLIINTTDNRFYLYRHRTLVREGFCSSGSYIHLKSHDEREWIFRTPRGMFRVLGKATYPVWRKPDWAFIEEGIPVPPPDHHSRFEYGALGDYALSIGDGYLIHGTLYKRSLGMPVTHGCVRLNDDDLKAVFNALSVGSKVYIY